MSISEIYCPACGGSNTPGEKACFACGSALTITGVDPLEQQSVTHLLRNRYRLLDIVGEGGFSTVYKAEDTFTHQIVAVKAITLRDLKAQEKIEATDAFNREVHMLTKLDHRNLPHIYDHFSEPECWYLVMDFIRGTTLEKRLERRGKVRLPQEEILDIGLVLCDVLHYLHAHEPAIIFRDLKPANIILTQDGHLFLIDFGIARHFKAGQIRDTIPFGSPGYAAPEQYGKAQTNPRADIYSLGAILHQLISGDDPSLHPFSFAPLSKDMADLDTLLQQMTSMEVNKRPENIERVKEELKKIAIRRVRQHGLQGQHPPMQRVQAAASAFSTLAATPLYTPSPSMGPAGQKQGAQQMYARQYAYTPHPPPPPILQPKVAQRIRKLGLLSLICGILSILLPFFTIVLARSTGGEGAFTPLVVFVLFSLLLTVTGIVSGHIARHRAKQFAGVASKARVIGTIGLVLSYIFFGLYTPCNLIFLLIFLFINVRH